MCIGLPRERRGDCHAGEQGSSIVSQFGTAVAAEAQACHQAMQQGQLVHSHLQQEEHVVSWMRREAQQAFAQKHVVCQSPRLEQSHARSETEQMEARLNEAQWQRTEYRMWHDEVRAARTVDQGRAERLRIALTDEAAEFARNATHARNWTSLWRPCARPIPKADRTSTIV